MLTFVAICVIVFVIGVIGTLSVEGIKSFSARHVDKKKVSALSTPESLLEGIRDYLPRNHGFMYELTTSVDAFNDLIIKVKITDPITEKELLTITFDSSYGSSSIKATIDANIKTILKRRDAERLSGITEIIT